MQNQKSQTSNHSEDQSKVVPSAIFNAQQDQNQQIHNNDNQQQIISNHSQSTVVNETIFLDQPIALGEQIQDQPLLLQKKPIKLVQFSKLSDQKQFIKRVLIINFIQVLLIQVVNIISSIVLDIEFVQKNNYILYIFYIIIAVTIALLFASLFIRPAKKVFIRSNYYQKCFQAFNQIIMTILYIFCSLGTIYLLPITFGDMIISLLNGSLNGYIIVYFTKYMGVDIYLLLRFIIQTYFTIYLIIVSVIFFKQGTEDMTIYLWIALDFLLFFAIEVAYAIIFQNSLTQLIDGKFKLRCEDYYAAAMIAFVNMFTPNCFQQA